MLMKIPGG